MRPFYFNFIFVTLSTFLYSHTSSSSVQLNTDNLDEILNGHEFVLVNFYADWCRFSQILSPIFDEAAKKIKEEFPEAGRVTLAKVDCDKEGAIAKKYHVSKYPTLKVFRNGELVKREFRGQRSVDHISKFIREQVIEPIIDVSDMDDLDNVDRKKRNIIGYFDSKDNDDYKTFRKVANTLRDDCIFHAAVGELSAKERPVGNKLIYRPQGEMTDLIFSSHMNNFDVMKRWTQDKCVPLVREITFENAEELTEEGLPFLILFHDPEDTDTPERFKQQVAKELLGEKNSVNTLVADGKKFSHPLYHLGKSTNDLPILAIDSFRHMYLWPKNPKEEIDKPGALKEFIADLHSGKLHREFHHGPDLTTKTGGQKNKKGKKDGKEDPTPDKDDSGNAVQVIGDGMDGKEHPPGDHVHVQMTQQVVMTPDGTPLQIIRIQQNAHKGKIDLKHISDEAEKAGTNLDEVAGLTDEEVKDTIEEIQDAVQERKEDEYDAFISSLSKRAPVEQLSEEMLQKIYALPGPLKEKITGRGFRPEVLAELTDDLLAGIPESIKRKINFERIRERLKIDPNAVYEMEDDGTEHLVLHEDSKTLLVKTKDGSTVEPSTDPPKSMFAHLLPSEHRYTILEKDEL